jgi:hypothetical protein
MMSAAELQQTKGLWKSIMKRKQLGKAQPVAVRNAGLSLADTMTPSFVPHVKKR